MALKAPLFDSTGKSLEAITLPEAFFGLKVNPVVLNQAIRVYQANQHQGTSAAQTRGQVDYSTAKLWRQKGTGRARHGSRKAPIFVGGGVAHGPKLNRNNKLKLTQSLRRLSLKMALSARHQDSAITIIEGLSSVKPKTKSLQSILGKITTPTSKKILFILHQPEAGLMTASKNVPHVSLTQAARLNVFEILNADTLIISKEVIEKWSSKDAPVKPSATTKPVATQTPPKPTKATPKTPTKPTPRAKVTPKKATQTTKPTKAK
jgi:large subunit ribosomal protein L4